MSLRSPHQHAGLLASYGNFSRMNPRRASPPSSVRRPALAAPSASRHCTGRCPLDCCRLTPTCPPSLAILTPIPTPTLPRPSPLLGLNPPHQGPLPRLRGCSQPPAIPPHAHPAPPCASQGGFPPLTPMRAASPPGLAPLQSPTPGIPPRSPRRLLRLNACSLVRMTLSRSLKFSLTSKRGTPPPRRFPSSVASRRSPTAPHALRPPQGPGRLRLRCPPPRRFWLLTLALLRCPTEAFRLTSSCLSCSAPSGSRARSEGGC